MMLADVDCAVDFGIDEREVWSVSFRVDNEEIEDIVESTFDVILL